MATDGREHRSRNFTRESTFFLPVNFLCADCDVRVFCRFQCGLQINERRTNDDLVAVVMVDQRKKIAKELASLVGSLVHLPVGSDQLFAGHQILFRNFLAQRAKGTRSNHRLSVRASTPGSFLPSRNSSEAPPPVEMWVILSATPAARTAETESPPPTIEIAPGFSATAWAILNVPLANGETSKTPMGPFHTMVRAREISSAYSSMVLGPISRPIMPGGIGCPPFTVCRMALRSMRSATT